MTTTTSGQQPQQAPASQQWTPQQIAAWQAQQAAAAQAQQQLVAAGLVQPNATQYQQPAAMPSPVLQTQSPLLPGIVMVGGNDNASPMVGLSAYEKMGKCLRGNTLVLDPRRGQLVSIREIVHQLKTDSNVLTMNVSSLLTPTTPVSFFENGEKQLYRLRTQSGFEIEATDNHPFLTPMGWKALKDLDPKSDRVATIAEYPQDIFWKGIDRSEAALKVLAYLIADGDIVQMVFTKNEKEVREEFIDAVEELGDVAKVFSTNSATAVQVSGGVCRALIEEACLTKCRAADKFLPAYAFGMKRAPTALLLNRLFTCDGSVEASGRLSFSSTSLRLTQQVRHLLARFGIVATVRDRMVDGQLYGRELLISSRANVIRFIDEVGFFGEKQLKAEALRERLAAGGKGDETQLWRHGPYLFDRVKSIEATVVEETYDIEIVESHNFVANDFVVHNSTTAITTLVGWPDQGKEPICIAWDPHGPDACVRLGYRPHVARVRDQPGEMWIDKHRYLMRTLRTNIDAVHRRYGSVVVDCASTCAMALHTDAQKLPKNANNNDTRAPYVEATLWMKECINAIIDLGLPNIWLSWLMEGSQESEKVEGAQNRKITRLGGPDIMGTKMRNFIAGKSHHNFILEKYKVQKGGTDPWGRPADEEGYVRVFHSKQWGLLNAGGRYSHVLPDPCPAHFGWILSRITNRGPF